MINWNFGQDSFFLNSLVNAMQRTDTSLTYLLKPYTNKNMYKIMEKCSPLSLHWLFSEHSQWAERRNESGEEKEGLQRTH